MHWIKNSWFLRVSIKSCAKSIFFFQIGSERNYFKSKDSNVDSEDDNARILRYFHNRAIIYNS